MKKTILSACSAMLILIACNNGGESTDAKKDSASNAANMDAKKDAPPAPIEMDSATMMKNWMAYKTPGKEHEMLAKANGSWTSDITMWMSPGAPAIKSTGTSVNKMALGGRYQVSTHTGSFEGQPFEGMSTTAYDNAKKKFITTWIDNMGTGIMVLEGPWDEATKSMTLTGKMVDPMDGKEKNEREVFKIIDDNNHLLEMYCSTPDGKGEFKTMEIKYTRKK